MDSSKNYETKTKAWTEVKIMKQRQKHGQQ